MSGAELMLVSAGLSALQGFQAYKQGQAQAKAATQTADYNARVIDQQGAVDRDRLKRQQRLFASQQRVRAAGTGATLGSFEDVFEDSTSQSLLDVALHDYNTRLRRDQAIYGGQVESSQASSRGRSNLFGSLINAGQSAYGYYNKPETVYWRQGGSSTF